MTAISAVPAPPKPTRLHDLHVELGATMTDFAGWSMPLRYGSETTEHRAVRTAAGLFDLSHMGEIEVAGSAACAALHHALVGDIAAMAVGGAKYTMICSGYTGEDGFEIFCAAADAPAIWAAALAAGAGAGDGLVPAGLACRDTLRLEAGMPLYGTS